MVFAVNDELPKLSTKIGEKMNINGADPVGNMLAAIVVARLFSVVVILSAVNQEAILQWF